MSSGGQISENMAFQPEGIILVHDLTNRKSQINLQKWLSEILNQDTNNPTLQHVDVDPEQFLGSTQIPILVIGTKFDLAEEKQRKNQYRRLASSIAEQCGADEIFVNSHQARRILSYTWRREEDKSMIDFIIVDDRLRSKVLAHHAKMVSMELERIKVGKLQDQNVKDVERLKDSLGEIKNYEYFELDELMKVMKFVLVDKAKKVIERRYYSRASPFSDKRRIPSYITSASTPVSSNKPHQFLSPGFYHMD
ncbi:Rab-like protein 3 [Eumeta japonica]|uniref:Rab-like protein 3 n=1 Tax=Eumeta variegata TaxID=151549 RepID=A0A4C1YC62_EUMVA|nr:Rab-like protein 3 [Eumeta japonica]